MDITRLSPTLFAAPQIGIDHLPYLADEGFTDIVCNRPDEEHPEDPDATVLADRAAALGMAFHYLPIRHGEPLGDQPRRLAEIEAKPGAKVLAYCRSGARSTHAWSLACGV